MSGHTRDLAFDLADAAPLAEGHTNCLTGSRLYLQLAIQHAASLQHHISLTLYCPFIPGNAHYEARVKLLARASCSLDAK